jgi:predicted RNase H-like HicB family nuclease
LRSHLEIEAIVHCAEEGGFWAHAPSIPGCATQGETIEELLASLSEAVEGCLRIDETGASSASTDLLIVIANSGAMA